MVGGDRDDHHEQVADRLADAIDQPPEPVLLLHLLPVSPSALLRACARNKKGP
jgi:hypothetical protein